MDKKFNQTKYINEFQKKNYRRYVLDIRHDQKHIINKLESVPNKKEYICKLIENDIKGENNND